MNNDISENLQPPPTRNARPPAVRTAHARTADILSAQAGGTPAVQTPRTADILSAQASPTPAAQITRTADILSAQAGQTRVALARLPAALGSR